jgi:hypothetical protein
MITTGTDGIPKVARVGVVLVDGKLWSSGTRSRKRTARLRNDPRCTLFVFDAGFAWLGLETTITIVDRSDTPAQSLRLFRVMQDKPEGPLNWFGSVLTDEEFLATMVNEERIIYEFEVSRSYGLV